MCQGMLLHIQQHNWWPKFQACYWKQDWRLPFKAKERLTESWHKKIRKIPDYTLHISADGDLWSKEPDGLSALKLDLFRQKKCWKKGWKHWVHHRKIAGNGNRLNTPGFVGTIKPDQTLSQFGENPNAALQSTACNGTFLAVAPDRSNHYLERWDSLYTKERFGPVIVKCDSFSSLLSNGRRSRMVLLTQWAV